VTTWVLTEGPDDRIYRPFRWHDAKLGGRFWLANFIQAGLFGLGHPQAEEFAVVIGAGAVWGGWQTRRNDWSIREVIFQHFWYDVAVVTAMLLRDDRHVVTLMPVRIRF
jgi:membrane protease YdiL (CAAX protease family)